MVVELRTKSQVTIPKKVVTDMGLNEGDKFEVFEKDGMICLVPVVVYPRKYVEELKKEAKNAKKNAQVFDSVDGMMK